MMDLLDQIILGDCLEILPSIPDKSIDAIICDPPYAVLNKSNASAKWDNIIPFEPMWEQLERIIKDNGAIVLFGQGMFTAKLILSNEKHYRYSLVWDKKLKTGFLNAKRAPLRQHEDIAVFYRKQPTYNPQMVKCEPHRRNHSKGNMEKPTQNRCYGNFIETPTIISDEKYPTSIISIPKLHPTGKSFHPTEKPINLMSWLIRTYTDTGGVVLDFCAGSGSTLVAAIRENRHFIGIELTKEYYDIASQRIKDEINDKKQRLDWQQE